jgi:prepilin-type processing-associated H-X9-DG protein
MFIRVIRGYSAFPLGVLCGFLSGRGNSSQHPGGANFLMTDGSVQFIKESIPNNIYQWRERSQRWQCCHVRLNQPGEVP